MERNNFIGFTCKGLANQYKRLLDALNQNTLEENITGMQIGVMHFISHQEGDVFQRDIERAFNIRRSTVSGILQLMEKNGLLCRESVASDARLKRLVLTDKARDISEMSHQHLLYAEDVLSEGISAEDLATFFAVAKKVSENMDMAIRAMNT